MDSWDFNSDTWSFLHSTCYFLQDEDFLKEDKSDMSDFHLHSEMTHFILFGVYLFSSTWRQSFWMFAVIICVLGSRMKSSYKQINKWTDVQIDRGTNGHVYKWADVLHFHIKIRVIKYWSISLSDIYFH